MLLSVGELMQSRAEPTISSSRRLLNLGKPERMALRFSYVSVILNRLSFSRLGKSAARLAGRPNRANVATFTSRKHPL